MKKVNLFLKTVLKKILPDKKSERELKSLAKKVLLIAKREAKKYKADAMIVGSITRNTWLPEKKEFDIFILFPKELTINELEEYGLKIGKEIVRKMKGSFTLKYAQHPYLSAKINDVEVDIVPCYKIKDTTELKSAVDRTPFHVKYLQKHLKKTQANEVRLLKKFLKSHNLYGADAKVQGFSGYLCELLIIKYKSFLNLLKAAVKWKLQEIIDLEGFYKKSEYSELKRIFRGQPLIVIDPTDKNRNVAAALSIENYFKFKKICKMFLENPCEETFFGKVNYMTDFEFSRTKLKRGTEILVICFKPPEVSPDILWPQLRKFAERIKSILEEKKYEFKVYGKDVYTDEKEIALVLIELEVFSLPNIQKIIGPPVFDERNSKAFLEAHKTPLIGPYVENGRWVVEIERKFKTAKEKIIDSLNKPVEILKAKGIPSYIADALAKGFKVMDSSEIEKLLKERKDVGIFFHSYFNKEKIV
ncbi:MAG: CCA tRNA nucleotidyltransferase [Candidatus Aenigmarchaeota archaeon]|nr:CCA tRNA nucleotidyltransferase [Candidatus Aenigmarchaeota archaeon]